MASEEHTEDPSAENEESNGGSSNGHNLGRVAAIAAASGATAYAAKKAFSSRSSSDESDDDSAPKKKKSSSSESSASLMTAAVASGWDVAKDSLVPIVEDAATKAGAFVADRAPELVRDVVVPRFIAGFERAKRGGKNESSDDE